MKYVRAAERLQPWARPRGARTYPLRPGRPVASFRGADTLHIRV